MILQYERYADNRYEEQIEHEDELVKPRKSMVGIGVVAFTIGKIDKLYGGPEEGGWYYDHFEPERTFIVSARQASKLERRLQRVIAGRNEGRYPLSSVLSNGLYQLVSGIEQRTVRPYYS